MGAAFAQVVDFPADHQQQMILGFFIDVVGSTGLQHGHDAVVVALRAKHDTGDVLAGPFDGGNGIEGAVVADLRCGQQDIPGLLVEGGLQVFVILDMAVAHGEAGVAQAAGQRFGIVR